ncbi:Metalloendopeptidase-like membrane protein (fragment) [Rhodospirillaceae bacterium LM-1]
MNDSMGRMRGLSIGLVLGTMLSGCYSTVSEPWWNQSFSQRPQAAQQRQAQPQPLPPGMIEVAKGDSVYGLAKRHGVGVREIIDANGLEAPFKLLVGQRLKIPQLAPQQPRQNVAALSLPAPAFPPPIASAQASVPEPTPAARPGPEPAALVFPEPRPKAGKGFLWPVKGPLVEGFGVTGKGQNNDGINIGAKRGAYVRASENGVVVYAGSELKGFGNMLLVKHQDGWVSAYAHNDLLLVGKGDRVDRGQAIARVGATGLVTSPQLHFELRHNSKPVNPLVQLVDG